MEKNNHMEWAQMEIKQLGNVIVAVVVVVDVTWLPGPKQRETCRWLQYFNHIYLLQMHIFCKCFFEKTL